MNKKFLQAVEKVLEHEGGFVNHPNDPGGATNYGVSLRYLIKRGDLDKDGFLDGDIDNDGDIDTDDIKLMTTEGAKNLYYTGFWEPNRLSEIQSYLLPAKIFDMTINMGSMQTWKLVQRAVNEVGGNLRVDGLVGVKTITAINKFIELDYAVLTAIRKKQLNFYSDLAAENPSFSVFKLGWFRRAVY